MPKGSKPSSERILSKRCDFGDLRCGTKLTPENRMSLKGWQVCKECYEAFISASEAKASASSAADLA
jgi:hypothetical protein